jgi:hypothetical protein
MIRKFIPFLILIYVLCGLTNISIFAQPFHIIKATQQKTLGGAAGMGPVIQYSIIVIVDKPSTTLHFDRLWVGDHFVSPEATKKALLNPTMAFRAKDTVCIYATYRQLGTRNVGGEIVSEKSAKMYLPKAPFSFKGAALLGYTVRKKRKYMAVRVFEDLTPVHFE